MHGISTTSGARRGAFLLALAAICGWLFLRGHGLYPVVFADEWYYSKMSRLMPLADALVPSYLYLWLFSASNACGAAFLDCVRIGNLALYIGALPFFHACARQATSQGWSRWLTLLAAAAPLNSSVLYFMPEATYWFGFCVLSWLVLTRSHWPGLRLAVASGAVLGALSLVKVHALFLLPSLCLYLVYAAWLEGGAGSRWLGRGLAAAAAAAAATLALKFGLGWLLAGQAGLSLLGPFYQSNVSSGSTSLRLALLGPILVSALGHLMALAVLLGVPLAILVHALASGTLARRNAPAGRLLAWTVLALGAAAGMAVLYTASLAAGDAAEGLRLHLRYYSFAFPLLWLVAAASLQGATSTSPAPAAGAARALRWAIAAVLAILVLVAVKALPGYAPSVIDGPEIAAVNMRASSGHVTVVLQLALLAVWAGGRWNAARLFLLCLLPVTILVGQDRIHGFMKAHRSPNPGERAAALVVGAVAPAERARLTLAGDAADLPQMMRAQFHIDRAGTAVLTLAPGAPVPADAIPAGHRWLLVMGAHAAPSSQVVRQADGMTLLRLP